MCGIESRLRDFFARAKNQGPSTEKLQERAHRVAESILENEHLTADLDDSAAKELLDWGLSAARGIVQDTADLDDDNEAEEAMYPRLRATRSLMRSVNLWIANQREGDAESSTKALDRVFEQAAIIYGRAFTSPNDEQREAFTSAQSQLADDPPQMIANLRQLFERSDDTPTKQEGEP